MKFSKMFSAAMASFAVTTIFTMNVFAEQAKSVDWTNSVITVTGIGFPSDESAVPSRAKTLAERAARADAYRQLAEIVQGVHVTGETTVQGLMILSDTVTMKVDTVIKGAKQISSRETGDGGMEVTVQMPLFGANSLAGSVLERPAMKVPFPDPVPSVSPTKPSYTKQTPVQQRIEIVVKNSPAVRTVPMSSANIFFTPQVVLSPMSNINISALPRIDTLQVPEVQIPATPQVMAPAVPQVIQPVQENLSSDSEIIGGYTGLIVDCRGLNLQAVMSPVIKNESGETIYGDKNLDYDKIIEMGMAAYSDGVTNMERAGKNPIVVKAVSLENFSSNPVLSLEDSNRVLLENKSSKFLDQMNVVFLQ